MEVTFGAKSCPKGGGSAPRQDDPFAIRRELVIHQHKRGIAKAHTLALHLLIPAIALCQQDPFGHGGVAVTKTMTVFNVQDLPACDKMRGTGARLQKEAPLQNGLDETRRACSSSREA